MKVRSTFFFICSFEMSIFICKTEATSGTFIKSRSNNTYSLVSVEVPLNRTCDDASIPELYCVCRMSHRVELPVKNISSQLSDLIANFTEQLNDMLPPEKCQRLSVHRVLSLATFQKMNSTSSLFYSILEKMRGKEVVEFTLEMAPSGAVLRTRMVRSGFSGWSVVSRHHEIERLNMYGNQSHCLEDRILRKYCLCLDVQGVINDQGTV